MIIIIEVLITVIVVLLFTKIYKDKKGKYQGQKGITLPKVIK